MSNNNTSNNRIPVNVNINADSPGGIGAPMSNNSSSTNQQQQQKFSTSSEYRSSSSSSNKQHQQSESTYNMRTMNDETDRIRERMREFEEHCRRVREQAFASRPATTTTNASASPGAGGAGGFFTSDIGSGTGPDQRVPSSTTFGVDSSGSRFGSSMHRSSIEDLPDGGKKYRIEFDIGDFYQNELHIATNGKTLVVKGEREQKVGSATETKTFNRELTLPDYVDVDRMNAFLLNNGPAPAAPASPSNSTSAPFRSSQTQLISQSAVNNVLVVEAPIIMDKYTYRRSVFDQSNKSQSPIRTSHHASPKYPSSTIGSSSRLNQNPSAGGGLFGANSTSSFNDAQQQHQRYENRTSSSSTSNQKVTRSTSGTNLLGGGGGIVDEYGVATGGFRPGSSSYTSQSNLNQSLSPELISGYPVYDAAESCVVYKFDLSGFDQSEIHLTITNDRVLEIRASKEVRDELGKIYREFKREIHLEPEVDDKLIKNVLHDGLLTLKIPKANRPDGLGSVSNAHNLGAPNGFRELYGDDGRLQKLTADFRGFAPENVRIVLSANNVLKVSAQQSEQSPTHKGGSVQKECTRHYTLPAWVQPENMKAIMSRDGMLTIDFNAANTGSDSTPTGAAATTAGQSSNSKSGDRINISN